jgi:hypothetical protein
MTILFFFIDIIIIFILLILLLSIYYFKILRKTMLKNNLKFNYIQLFIQNISNE